MQYSIVNIQDIVSLNLFLSLFWGIFWLPHPFLSLPTACLLRPPICLCFPWVQFFFYSTYKWDHRVLSLSDVFFFLEWPESSLGFFHKMVQKTPNKLSVQTNTWYLVLHYPGLASSLQCWQRCPFLFLPSFVCVWWGGRGTFRFSDSQGTTLLTQLYHPIFSLPPTPFHCQV